MGFSPESYTFMTMGRLHRVDSQAKLGVVSGRWLVVSGRRADSRRETSILRTRLVPSKSIRRYKFTETAEENKVEQATVRF